MRMRCAISSGCLQRLCGILGKVTRQRQKYRYQGSASTARRSAAEMNSTLVLFYDPLAHPQTQAGASFFFGGKEGLKKAGLVFLRYAAAGIGNGDPRPGSP